MLLIFAIQDLGCRVWIAAQLRSARFSRNFGGRYLAAGEATCQEPSAPNRNENILSQKGYLALMHLGFVLRCFLGFRLVWFRFGFCFTFFPA